MTTQTVLIILVVLLVACILAGLISRYMDLTPPYKGLVIILIFLVACIYILHLVGVF